MFSRARRLQAHTSLMKKVLSLQLRLWKPPLYIVPFMEEYVRKGSSALRLWSREQSQAAKSVIWPSAWVCTFHPSSLSLPFIFYQQYFLNYSNSALWQADILQLLPNQSCDLSSPIPKDSPVTVFIFGARRKIHPHLHLLQPCNPLSIFLPAFILKLLQFMRLILSLHTFPIRYFLVSMRSLPPFWILLRLIPFLKILSAYCSQLLLWASLIYDLFFPADH